MKKGTKNNFLIKYFMEIFLLFLLIGIILVNSFYTDGFSVDKLSVDNGLSSNIYGYTLKDSKYIYDSKEQCYMYIPNNPEVKELLFYFNNVADRDIEINVYHLNSNDEIKETNSTVLWRKGTQYFKIITSEEANNGYCLIIPTDFDINSVYYAIPENSGIKKIYMYILVIFIAIALSFLSMLSSVVINFLDYLEKKIISEYDKIKKNRKKLLIALIVFCLNIAFSIIVIKILEKSGLCKYNWKTIILCISILIIAETALFLRKYFANKIEVIGFITILFIGTIFTVLESPIVGNSWDDGIHYNRVAVLSHALDKHQPLAELIGRENEIKNRQFYREETQDAYCDFLDEITDSKYYISNGDVSALISSTGVAYIPSVLGLVFARGIGLPYHIQFVVGKWMNVLLFAILCYYAMKKLKSGKLIALLIALIPTNIFLASNYSYDTWLTGWSMLGLCTFFGEIQRPDQIIKKKSIWIIFISMLLAVLPKMVYFPLTFIVFFMPRSKFSSKKDYWKYKLLILFNIAIPFIFVLMKNVISVAGTTGQGDMRGGEDVDSGGQIAYILSNPLQTFKTMFNFLKDYLNPWIEGREYINNLAYNGLVPYYKIVLLVILVSALVSRNEKEEGKYPWWFRSGVVLVYAGIGALAAIALYILFTPVGSDIVAGCQGRYIIPALFPTLFVLTRFSGRTYVKNFVKEENINCLAVSVLALFSLYGMWMGCVSLY